MFLQKLSVVNYKNYSHLELEFLPKLNCFVGNNGVGKTNLLDAIFYLSMCKSYFNSIDGQNIKHGEEFFVIQGEYFIGEQQETIYCGVKRGKRKIFKRNRKEYERLADHIGLLPIVMVSPNDSQLILEGSEERRRYIDSVISQFDKLYLDTLMRYNRALEQRNKLLKDFTKTSRFDYSYLEIWDEQLIAAGTMVYEKRVQFIEKLLPVFQKHYDFVSSQSEKVGLVYESQLHGTSFRELLKNALDKDRAAEYTTVGIHKDDLSLRLGEYPIKRIGSQGQQKTYLLALKLAQFDFINEISHMKPIILLDDIFDKLDANRVTQIIKLVASDNFGQIFITDTSQERLERIFNDANIENRIIRIE